MTDPLRRFFAHALRPVDVAWLAALRAIFGLLMFVSSVRFIAYGWIDEFFVVPRFHFKYFGFAWVEPLSAPAMHALFYVLAALSLSIAVGLWFRVTSILFCVVHAYLQLIDVANYINHYYLATLLGALLCLSPANAAWSLDGRLRPRVKRDMIPVFWLFLFRFQIGVVYTFAGLGKANTDWLVHAQPLSIWLASFTDLPFIGPLLRLPWTAHVMSWAGFLFDTTITWWLLASKTRPYAYPLVIVFHALTGLFFPMIGMFPVIMTLSALVFFSPSWPRRAIERARRAAGRTTPEPNNPPPARLDDAPIRPSPWTRAVVLLSGVWCLVQIAMPLRHLAYGGNVLWHEQGMRFAWRVMLREKNGSITYVVRQKDSGRVWHVHPGRYLTPVQIREISAQPDLILQLAHHIRDDFAARGLGPVEVRVEALVSLNGRRVAPIIDPSVDLATVRDGVQRARWILPCPATPAPHIHPA